MIASYQVRVVRQWPGGPRKGEVVGVNATRREQLLRMRMVEAVDEEKVAPSVTKKKRRHAALNG